MGNSQVFCSTLQCVDASCSSNSCECDRNPFGQAVTSQFRCFGDVMTDGGCASVPSQKRKGCRHPGGECRSRKLHFATQSYWARRVAVLIRRPLTRRRAEGRPDSSFRPTGIRAVDTTRVLYGDQAVVCPACPVHLPVHQKHQATSNRETTSRSPSCRAQLFQQTDLFRYCSSKNAPIAKPTWPLVAIPGRGRGPRLEKMAPVCGAEGTVQPGIADLGRQNHCEPISAPVGEAHPSSFVQLIDGQRGHGIDAGIRSKRSSIHFQARRSTPEIPFEPPAVGLGLSDGCLRRWTGKGDVLTGRTANMLPCAGQLC